MADSKIKNYLHTVVTNKTIWVCLFLTALHFACGYNEKLEIVLIACEVIFLIILPIQSSFCLFAYLHCFTIYNYVFLPILTLSSFCFILIIKYIIGLVKGKYIFYKRLFLVIIAFLLLTIATGIGTPLYKGAWIYLSYPILFYLVFAMRKEFKISQAMTFMLLGIIFSVALGIISYWMPNYLYDCLIGERFTAFVHNPNYLYMRVIFVLSYFMYKFLNNTLPAFAFFLIYSFCAATTLTTLSKAGLTMLLIFTTLFIILFLKGNFKKRFKWVALFFLILALIVFACHEFVVEIYTRFKQALEGADVIDNLTTGRLKIWKDYLKASCKNPFRFAFGNGILSQEVFIESQGRTRASHNLYIFLLYRFGLVGCIALGFIIHYFIKLLRKEKPKLIAYLPLLYFLLESFCDNTFKPYNITFLLFGIMILYMDCPDKKPVKLRHRHRRKKTR